MKSYFFMVFVPLIVQSCRASNKENLSFLEYVVGILFNKVGSSKDIHVKQSCYLRCLQFIFYFLH